MIPQKSVVIHNLSTRLLFDPVQNLGHLVIKASALFHQIRDLLVGIHNRGVVSVAKKLPNLRKG